MDKQSLLEEEIEQLKKNVWVLSKKIGEAVPLVDQIYPVGSIFLSINKTNPQTFLGGEWQLLQDGKALWTTTSDNAGGQTVDAALPNITGGFSTRVLTGASGAGITNNPNSAITAVDNELQTAAGSGSNQRLRRLEISFDASLSNSIYKNSATVQPPAIRVYAWKRIS